MSDATAQSMTFQASLQEVFAALQHAAQRSGLLYMSGDAATGTYMYTAGMTVMAFGEKVTVRIAPVTAETTQVTVSSDLQFGVQGALSRKGARADLLAEALGEQLPRVG